MDFSDGDNHLKCYILKPVGVLNDSQTIGANGFWSTHTEKMENKRTPLKIRVGIESVLALTVHVSI